MSTQNPMPISQALALALCLIDWELESPAITPPPEDWQSELKAARIAIEQTLRPQIPAAFRPVRERAGRRRLRGSVIVISR